MTAAQQKSHQPLDEVMLAMDVVDTLRHRQRVVERALEEEGQEELLLERLHDIYAAQGIEVPEHILKQGVEALREDRFTYHPTPAAGWRRKLAELYIERKQWGEPAKWIIAGIVALFVGWQIMFVRPQARVAEQLQIELTRTIPASINQLVGRASELSKDDSATRRALALAQDAQAASKAGDIETARANQQELKALVTSLEQSYELRVISRPGEFSGVWRLPDTNLQARNYYVIVEPISASGKVMSISVRNEENGSRQKVTKLGVRVSHSVFEQVQADKSDDGIIQASLVGRKERGQLQPNYTVPVLGGVITEW